MEMNIACSVYVLDLYGYVIGKLNVQLKSVADICHCLIRCVQFNVIKQI